MLWVYSRNWNCALFLSRVSGRGGGGNGMSIWFIELNRKCGTTLYKEPNEMESLNNTIIKHCYALIDRLNNIPSGTIIMWCKVHRGFLLSFFWLLFCFITVYVVVWVVDKFTISTVLFNNCKRSACFSKQLHSYCALYHTLCCWTHDCVTINRNVLSLHIGTVFFSSLSNCATFW